MFLFISLRYFGYFTFLCQFFYRYCLPFVGLIQSVCRTFRILKNFFCYCFLDWSLVVCIGRKNNVLCLTLSVIIIIIIICHYDYYHWIGRKNNVLSLTLSVIIIIIICHYHYYYYYHWIGRENNVLSLSLSVIIIIGLGGRTMF